MQDLSIVIPVRNDPLLARAVGSTPADVEVIIAMTNPPPEAVEAALKLGKGRNLRVATTKTAGMAAGVNLGARLASHQKIIILDSDCRLLPGALAAYSQALDKHPFVRGMTIVERNSFWSRVAALGTERLNRVFAANPRFFGPSIAFRKNDFFKFGGYDEQMLKGSCDHEFALQLEKAKIPIHFSKDAGVAHQPLSFKIDTRSHIGYGHGMCYIDRKFGGFYGLFYCLKRLSPHELLIRAIERGGMSVLRSILLGSLMLWGYLMEFRSAKKN